MNHRLNHRPNHTQAKAEATHASHAASRLFMTFILMMAIFVAFSQIMMRFLM
jgi:hypothetical protein